MVDMEVDRFDDPDVFHEAPMIENWEFDIEDTGMNAAGPWLDHLAPFGPAPFPHGYEKGAK